jgi:histidyl-tRNA synthetase
VLNALDLYPDNAKPAVTVMFANLGDAESLAAMRLIKTLRAAGISAEIYPDNAKMKKQMNFADATAAQFVAFIGESELAANQVTIKNMTSGNQATVSVDDMVATIKTLN